ncbi:unnamed protein product [Discosporangium mesarthrocarpum]
MDPYLKLQCMGKTFDTERHEVNGKRPHKKRQTVDPLWYFTWEADLMLPEASLSAYFPQVVNLQLYDWDALGDDDYSGTCFFPLSELPVEPQADVGPPPRPMWQSLFLEEPGDSIGELLLSFQLIKTRAPGVSLIAAPDISPPLRPAFVEVLALGVRGMWPFELLPIAMPYMELEMDLPRGKRVSATTKASRKPSGPNANFLERIKMEVELPLEEIFAPRMKLRVRDTRLGGFLKPVVGVGAVNLQTKLPWTESYQPPASSVVDIEGIMKPTGAPVFERMYSQGEAEDVDPGEDMLVSTDKSGKEEGLNRRTIEKPPPMGPAGDGAGAGVRSLEDMEGGVMPLTEGAAIRNGGAEEEKGEFDRKVGGGVGAPPVPAGVGAGAGAGATGAVGSVPMAPMEIEMVKAMGGEDSGTGVFGALLHEPGESGLSCQRKGQTGGGILLLLQLKLCVCVRVGSHFSVFLSLVLNISSFFWGGVGGVGDHHRDKGESKDRGAEG